MSDETTCEKPLTTGARCRRKARYQVNGHLACARHLQGSITHYAVANGTGHLWASVQILPAVPTRPDVGSVARVGAADRAAGQR